MAAVDDRDLAGLSAEWRHLILEQIQATNALVREVQREVGELKLVVAHMVDPAKRLDDHEERIKGLETWRNYVLGIFVALQAVAILVWSWLTDKVK